MEAIKITAIVSACMAIVLVSLFTAIAIGVATFTTITGLPFN